MITKIALAAALALVAIANLSASAAPFEPYPKGYQDSAYNKNGW
jgi:hypothetical protein